MTEIAFENTDTWRKTKTHAKIIKIPKQHQKQNSDRLST